MIDRRLISRKMCKIIFQYYKELYRNYDMKYTSEIAKELGITEYTVQQFLSDYISPESDNTTEVGMIIMLCTKFATYSIYYEKQQEVFGDMIKKRMEIKANKDRHDQIVKMVRMRSAEYMKRKRQKGL